VYRGELSAIHLPNNTWLYVLIYCCYHEYFYHICERYHISGIDNWHWWWLCPRMAWPLGAGLPSRFCCEQ